MAEPMHLPDRVVHPRGAQPRMEVWPDQFGRALLARQWGRIGTEGRVRLDPHPDAAVSALAELARAKRRRSYRDSQ